MKGFDCDDVALEPWNTMRMPAVKRRQEADPARKLAPLSTTISLTLSRMGASSSTRLAPEDTISLLRIHVGSVCDAAGKSQARSSKLLPAKILTSVSGSTAGNEFAKEVKLGSK